MSACLFAQKIRKKEEKRKDWISKKLDHMRYIWSEKKFIILKSQQTYLLLQQIKRDYAHALLYFRFRCDKIKRLSWTVHRKCTDEKPAAIFPFVIESLRTGMKKDSLILFPSMSFSCFPLYPFYPCLSVCLYMRLFGKYSPILV